jgi:hypothetical protein
MDFRKRTASFTQFAFCRRQFGFEGHIRLRKKIPNIGENAFSSSVVA